MRRAKGRAHPACREPRAPALALAALVLPAKNDRENAPRFGNSNAFPKRSNALLTVHLLQSCLACRLPRFFPAPNSAGGRTSPLPRFPVSIEWFSACFFPPPDIVSCAVLPLSRLMSSYICLQMLCVTGARWIRLLCWRALTIPARAQSGHRCGKKPFGRNGVMPVPCGARHLRAVLTVKRREPHAL